MQSRNDGLDLSLCVVPRLAKFPAKPKIKSQVRLQFVGILTVNAAVVRAGIEELLTALVVAGGGAQQEVGKVNAGLKAGESEVAIGSAGVPFVDLQRTELASKLQRVRTNYFGKIVGEVPRVVGLVSGEGGHADGKVIEVKRWHGLRKTRGAGRIDAERAEATYEA